MPYALRWLDEEQSVLVNTAEGMVVTWDEYHAVYDEALALVKASSHRVDMIADTQNRMPPGNPLPHFNRLIAKWNGVDTFGMLVVVRNSRMTAFVQVTAGIAGKMMNVPIVERVIFATSVDEALSKIRADRLKKGETVKEMNPYGS